MNTQACVYFVSTPIGNLSDITYRAVEVLKSADFIACEDTRQSIKLFNHYGISKPLISYHKFNELNAAETIINRVLSGEICAVVSDAGTPMLCDPGCILVKRLIDENIPFFCIPGANAALPAMLYSGFDFTSFTFFGFLSDKRSTRKKELDKIIASSIPTIVYLPPHDTIGILTELNAAAPLRRLSVSREITKIHETTYRGTASELIDLLPQPLKGEMVLVVDKAPPESEINYTQEQLSELFESYFAQTADRKTALKLTAEQTGIKKRELYDLFMK